MGVTPACPPESSRTAPFGPRSASGAQALLSAPSPPLPAFTQVLVLPLLGVLLPIRRGEGKRILRPVAPGRALTLPGRTAHSTEHGFADPQVASLEGQLLVLLGLSGATGGQVTSPPPASR